MVYETLEVSITCEGVNTAYTELEDFELAETDAAALERKMTAINDIERLLELISEYCDGYPKELTNKGKSDKFVDTVRSMDFERLKTLEFHHFVSDFDAPVDNPPLEIYTDLFYDFTERKATSEYKEC